MFDAKLHESKSLLYFRLTFTAYMKWNNYVVSITKFLARISASYVMRDNFRIRIFLSHLKAYCSFVHLICSDAMCLEILEKIHWRIGNIIGPNLRPWFQSHFQRRTEISFLSSINICKVIFLMIFLCWYLDITNLRSVLNYY